MIVLSRLKIAGVNDPNDGLLSFYKDEIKE